MSFTPSLSVHRQVVTDHVTIGVAARLAGTTPFVLRAWSARYGWPSPPRSRGGFRLFSPREIEQIKVVLARHRAGAPLGELLAGGQPHLPEFAAPPSRQRFDVSHLAVPATAFARDAHADLIGALIQRHPGLVRGVLARRPHIRPADRHAAIDGVLAAYRDQIPDHAWLDQALEFAHAS